MQVVHVVVLSAVMPLREVGWQACIVDLEEALVLAMAATLLAWGATSPTWLKDGIVWMFPVIIATMLLGDATAAGAKMLRGAWKLMLKVFRACGCGVDGQSRPSM